MAKEFVMGARLTLRDMLTKPFTAATKVSEQFKRSAEKTDKAVKDLGRTTDKTRDSVGRFTKQGKGLGSMLDGLTPANMAASAAIAGVGYAAVGAIQKTMTFEAQMSTIKALTGATGQEMQQMQALALKMGAETKYSALQAGQGIEELLKAGLTPAQVQAGGLEAALTLATAGGLELADAAEIMSTSLNAYKADGLKASQAADILAGTANASATGVQELRYSLSMVSAVASGVGMSFKDTNIALGLFANNGLKGSDAGTSLKSMLMNLQPTTDKQTAVFKKLGLVTAGGANQFFTAAGKLKSLKDISGLLQKSMGGLTDQQRMLAMEIMFGSDAIRAGNILFKEGAAGVDKFNKEMSKVTALAVAKEKMNNAAGAVEQFRGAVETLQISALLPTMPLIKRFALAAADTTTKLDKWLGSNQALAWGQGFVAVIKAVRDAVMPVVMALYTNWISLYKIFQAHAPKLKAALLPVFQALRSVMLSNVGTIDALYGIVRAVFPVILKVIEKVAPIVATLLKGIGATVEWLINNVVKPLVPVIGFVFEAAWAVVSPILTLLDKALKGIGWVLKNTVGKLNISKAMGLDKEQSVSVKPKVDGSHASGLSRVPYDGYIAELHKGEEVVTAKDARDRRLGRGVDPAGPTRAASVSRAITIGKLFDKLVLKDVGDKDTDKLVTEFMNKLYDKLQGAEELLSTGDKGALA